MRYYSVKDTEMSAIADAIRVKTGKADGMTPAQMSEEISNIPDQIEVEEVVTPLNMVDGDMMVLPTDGKAISKVIIQKPETLTPENIAKDVDVAGVVGTLEGGGGASTPLPVHFMWVQSWANFVKSNTTSTASVSREIVVPHGAVIDYAFVASNMAGGTSSSTSIAGRAPLDMGYSTSWMNGAYQIVSGLTLSTSADSGDIYSVSLTHKPEISSRNYRSYADLLVVYFTVPGIYYTINKDGKRNIIFYENAPAWKSSMAFGGDALGAIGILDLSQSNYINMGSDAFYGYSVDEIILPPETTNICLKLKVSKRIDLSLVTAVPKLTELPYTFYGYKIYVPSALYDAFLVDTKWATYADYIVAV